MMKHDNIHKKLWCMVTGVEHVAGDMFEKVPGGCDCIFVKVNFKLYLDVDMNTCSKRKTCLNYTKVPCW